MIRLVNTLILVSFWHIATGQADIGYLYEELPNDSSSVRTNKMHSSLKPEIRLSAEESLKKVQLSGLADLNYMQQVQGKYKTGLGVEFTASLNDKWYLRIAGVQGISSATKPFDAKSYLTFNSDSTSYLYTDIRSRIGFTPNQVFNFQVGLDHNFLGEGSRSLLLSDYGKPYPFGQIRARFWRMEYSILYQFMNEQINGGFNNKFLSSHHISFNAAPWLNFGIFESVIFQPKDSTLTRGFDAEYLNPLVFFRPQEYSIGSSDNVLLGLDFSARWKKHTMYGQFILDEFYLSELRAKSGWWANKFGGQFGVKGRFNYHGNWFYRLEYNFVRPYTYSHISEKYNYGNMGLPLGHPYGSNFMEVLGEIKYQNKKWTAKSFNSYYLTGDDKDGYNFGSDISQSYVNRPYEYGHFIGQGIQRNGLISIWSLSYQVTKHGNLNAFIENHFRYTVQDEHVDYMLVVGLRSLLWNDHRNY